jgi:hypothetical protein
MSGTQDITDHLGRVQADSIKTDALVVGPRGTVVGNQWIEVTPTFTAGTLGTGGIKTLRYTVIGKTVHWSLNAQQTATGTCSGGLLLNLPVPARVSLSDCIGAGTLTTSASFVCAVRLVSSTTADFLAVTGGTVAGPQLVGNAATNVNPQSEASWTLIASGTYEAL